MLQFFRFYYNLIFKMLGIIFVATQPFKLRTTYKNEEDTKS